MEKKSFWVVLEFTTRIGVKTPGGYVTDAALSWSEGMVGVLPVFGTKAEAEAYAESTKKTLLPEIMEIERVR